MAADEPQAQAEIGVPAGCDLVTLIATHTDAHAGRATLEWQAAFSQCAADAGVALPTSGLAAHYDPALLDLADGAAVASWPDAGPNGYDGEPWVWTAESD